MDNNSKKASSLGSTLVEVGVAGVLIILILSTLNYFGILPLSSNFKFLSFLPTQTKSSSLFLSPNSGVGKRGNNALSNVVTRVLVRPIEPKKLVNGTDNFLFAPIASSSVKIKDNIRIDMELTNVQGSSATQGSSLVFRNSFKYQDSKYRHLRVFYYPKNKVWILEARSKNKSQFFTLKKENAKGPNFAKVGLIVNPSGKSVTLLVAGKRNKTIVLADSLYDSGKVMNSSVQIAPHSELDIYGLYYQY